MRINSLLVLCAALYSTNNYALTPDAIQGKALYPACHVCHDQVTSLPLGPPMWGVQSRYIRNSLDKEGFVKSMTTFVKAPTLKSAIHEEAVDKLGLMPAMPLPDNILNKIATYIFEEKFPPPCEHWKITVENAVIDGDMEHAEKVERQLQRFCN